MGRERGKLYRRFGAVAVLRAQGPIRRHLTRRLRKDRAASTHRFC